jgi:hypothetical protein
MKKYLFNPLYPPFLGEVLEAGGYPQFPRHERNLLHLF